MSTKTKDDFSKELYEQSNYAIITQLSWEDFKANSEYSEAVDYFNSQGIELYSQVSEPIAESKPQAEEPVQDSSIK